MEQSAREQTGRGFAANHRSRIAKSQELQGKKQELPVELAENSTNPGLTYFAAAGGDSGRH